MRLKYFSLLLVTVIFFGCKTEKVIEENPLEKEIAAIKSEFAPDKRVVVFAIEAKENEGSYILKGESNLPKAVDALKQKLVNNKVKFIDSIQLLPAKDLADKTKGIIRISVANLRSNPKHSAELATQATLGTPVSILKKEGDWFYIQTPDNYLAWVDAGGITPLSEQVFKNWKSTSKIIYTKTYGHSYTEPHKKEIVSDLVAGSVLEVLKDADAFYIVQYPDGRKAYVSKDESADYRLWLDNLEPSAANLVEISKTLMGVPYLWGGTSTKGMDCSGFTKTIYFLNGMVIPRDASQQVHVGIAIDSVSNFNSLKEGDLLFFGRKATDTTKEKVVHVGMWIGNNKFIHASELVRVSSMDENADGYDAFNKNRYLRTQRILKTEDDLLLNLKQSSVFKD